MDWFKERIRKLITAACASKHITNLSMANTAISDSEARVWLPYNFLFFPKHLSVLHSQGLLELLETSPSLKVLNIESNFITPELLAKLLRATLTTQCLIEFRAENQVRQFLAFWFHLWTIATTCVVEFLFTYRLFRYMNKCKHSCFAFFFHCNALNVEDVVFSSSLLFFSGMKLFRNTRMFWIPFTFCGNLSCFRLWIFSFFFSRLKYFVISYVFPYIKSTSHLSWAWSSSTRSIVSQIIFPIWLCTTFVYELSLV